MGRRPLLLITALVVAAIGTTLVFLYVNGVNDRAVADQRPLNVLVATKQINAGTTAAEAEKSAAIDLKPISRDSVAEHAVGDLAAIRGKVAVSTIYPGEQILDEKFSETAQTSQLVIPPGKMAVSVQAGDQNRVGGFLTPGSHVAVFVTTSGNGGVPEVKPLLPNIELIANGTATLTSGTTEGGTESGLLTFAATQDEAQRLILATKGGELYFTLLRDDSDSSSPDGLNLNQILR